MWWLLPGIIAAVSGDSALYLRAQDIAGDCLPDAPLFAGIGPLPSEIVIDVDPLASVYVFAGYSDIDRSHCQGSASLTLIEGSVTEEGSVDLEAVSRGLRIPELTAGVRVLDVVVQVRGPAEALGTVHKYSFLVGVAEGAEPKPKAVVLRVKGPSVPLAEQFASLGQGLLTQDVAFTLSAILFAALGVTLVALTVIHVMKGRSGGAWIPRKKRRMSVLGDSSVRLPTICSDYETTVGWNDATIVEL